MIVSIHQPQYIPWLPYFKKIDNSDIFILLDNVNFQKNGLQNRNQIKTNTGLHWLTVPIKHKLGQKIMDTTIDNNKSWGIKHWKTIKHNYQNASEFHEYKEELEKF